MFSLYCMFTVEFSAGGIFRIFLTGRFVRIDLCINMNGHTTGYDWGETPGEAGRILWAIGF